MRLLLADDHRIVRDGLTWMLSGEPDIVIVGEVSDGQQLIDALAAADDDVDIVLLDIRMPGLGGLEALQRIAAAGRTRSPAIVVLSMHQEPAVVRRAIELGAAGYLLKSSTRDELLACLRQVAAGNGFVQPEVTGPLLDRLAGRGATSEPTLTPREVDVLRLVAAGHSNKQVAARLGVTVDTVKTHLKAVFVRLGVANRTEAVTTALRLGLIEPS